MSRRRQSEADAVLQRIVESQSEVECNRRLSQALECRSFWRSESDFTSSTMVAMRAVLNAAKSNIATLALVRLLREPGGHAKPIAGWLAAACREPLLDTVRFVSSFSASSESWVADGPAIDFARDRAEHDHRDAWLELTVAEMKRTGSACYPCYPCYPWLLIDERPYSAGRVGTSYDAENDILYVRVAGSPCAGHTASKADGLVVLALSDAERKKVVGVTVMGASLRREVWSKDEHARSIPAELLAALRAWPGPPVAAEVAR